MKQCQVCGFLGKLNTRKNWGGHQGKIIRKIRFAIYYRSSLRSGSSIAFICSTCLAKIRKGEIIHEA